MPYPCATVDVKLGSDLDEMKNSHLQKRGCEIEQALKQYPIKIGAFLIVASLAMSIFMDLMTRLMYCIYYNCGRPHWVLNSKRLLWRPLLIFWHSWIHAKIPHLKYS